MDKKLLLLLLVAANSLLLSATCYYASPLGNGSGNSYQDPSSISAGISHLTAGDTLFLLGGTYHLSTQLNISKSGTEAKRTAIFAYPNEKPILDFRAQAYGERGISISSTAVYIHIKGLIICYAGKNGLINQGSYCQIENVEVYGCGDTGIQMKGGGHNYILNCDSHDNFDYQLGGVKSSDFGGNADGFADKQYTGGANVYEGCRSWNNSDDGWDFYQHVSSSTPTIMKNCICYKNGPEKYDMRNHARYNTDKVWFDQFTSNKTVIDADGFSATVSLENYKNWGNGNGFKLGGAQTKHDVEVLNCLSVGNGVRGFDQNNNFGTMTLYNNTAYDNGTNYGFGNNSGGTLIIKNCISLQTHGANSFRCQSTVNQNNSWNIAGISCTTDDFSNLDSALVLAPRNADGSLPATMFMQLAAGSNMINAGVNVGLPYSGTAPDLGCYEYGTLDQYPGQVKCLTNNTSQNLQSGQTISNIVFEWSGGATGLEIDAVPAGIVQNIDTNAKTLTLSGTPTFIGTQTYTVRTLGGSTYPASISGSITVKSNTARQIAYVTIPNSNADAKILERLNANINFSITIEDATTINNYSGYDLVVISAVPSSKAAGLNILKGIDKPLLLLKPFMLKNGVWNWGVAQNTADLEMEITMPEHVIFSNLTTTDNKLRIFSECNTNAVTYISTWTNADTPTQIATPTSAIGQSIAEMNAGANMNGTTLTQKMLMVGMSEYSTANLTEMGVTLIENACYYLLGMPIPKNTSTQEIQMPQYLIIQNKETLQVSNSNAISELHILNLAGQNISSVKGNQIAIGALPNGIYILIIRENQNVKFQKFIKR